MSELTFYPDADPETTSIDGDVYRAALTQTWTELRDGAGTDTDGSTDYSYVNIAAHDTSAKWRQLIRAIILFDTSSLPDTCTITNATLSLYGYIKKDELGITPDINIYASTPASNIDLANADYSNLGSTPFCDTVITYTNWSVTGYNNFTLNAAGIAAISLTGITKLGARNANYDVANIEPSWTKDKTSYLGWYTADFGQVTAPKLTVTYCVSPTTVTNLATNIDSANSYLSGILTVDGGEACDCGFQWGLTNAYGSTTSTVSLTTGQGFSLLISGLAANTTYHFRAFATNSAGTSYGSDVAFVAGVSSNSGYIWVETDDNRFHFIDAAGTEQIDVAQSDVDDTPVNAATTVPISSNWAYDHQVIGQHSEILLTPKASSTGAEGTVFYCNANDSLYVGTE